MGYNIPEDHHSSGSETRVDHVVLRGAPNMGLNSRPLSAIERANSSCDRITTTLHEYCEQLETVCAQLGLPPIPEPLTENSTPTLTQSTADRPGTLGELETKLEYLTTARVRLGRVVERISQVV